MLDLQIMIAGSERTHLVALTPACPLRDGTRLRVQALAALLDPLKVLCIAVTPAYRPKRTTRQHGVHFGLVQANTAGAADSCRNCASQLVCKFSLHRLDPLTRQAGRQRADSTGDVKPDSPGRDDAALHRIERGNAADRKTIAPMRVRHRIRRADDSGKAGDIGQLCEDLVIHVAQQGLIGVEDSGYTHGTGWLDSPPICRFTLQLADVHLALHVDDTLGIPPAARLAGDAQFGVGCTLDLDRRLVALWYDGLACQCGGQLA